MVIPSKHENLQRNLLVVGADILSFLKKKQYNVENLFQEIRQKKSIGIDQFYNILSFLYTAELIDFNDFSISIKNNYVS
ncbi:MAG: ABC-three component system middle component 6 [Parcubacteria group bacterium]|jgi:Fe2+ or Zn2+ uptake regulation protein